MLVKLISLIFLLAACYSEPVVSAPEEGPINTVGVDPQAILDIFVRDCASCHNPSGSASFLNILDYEELVEKGKLVPGDPDLSRVYIRVSSDAAPMPPAPAEKLSQEDQKLLYDWIAEGAPKWDAPNIEVPFLDYANELRGITYDLLNNVKERDREYTRYLVLSNISNAEKLEELKLGRLAIGKLLNSVTFSPILVAPIAIDWFPPLKPEAGKSPIVRINLEDYDLEIEDWDDLVERGNYPYFLKRFDDEDTLFYEKEIQNLTKNFKTVSFIRADWFIDRVSRAPFYNDFLYGRHKINTDRELEKLLGVELDEQFEDEEAKRTLVRNSGVAHFNRAIDYAEIEYGAGGIKYDSVYWKTYDVLNENNARNMFANPFGPKNQFDLITETKKEFQHDNTEIIFRLPNGLSGYFLCAVDHKDSVCKRIDFADTQIVFDPSNVNAGDGGIIPSGKQLVAGGIINGVSCMGCHHSGSNPYQDQGKAFVVNGASGAGFNNAEVNLAKLVMPEAFQLSRVLQNYVETFHVAQNQLGVSPVQNASQGTEPIYQTARYYNGPVDVCELGAMFYKTCDEARDLLIRAEDLALALGYGADGSGYAQAKAIEDNFDTIAQEFDIGKQVKFGKVIIDPPKCKLSFQNKSKGHVRFQLKLAGGNWSDSFTLNVNGSKVFDTKLGGSVFINSWTGWISQKNYLVSACKSHSFKHVIKNGNNHLVLFED